jgi:excisionase family DNA binding protein
MSVPELHDIDEAARRLGLSTLRVRQLIRERRLDAVRDNRGHWRVRLPSEPLRAPRHSTPLDDGAGVEILIEEAIELRDRLIERERAIESMAALVERQQRALADAVARVEVLHALASEARRLEAQRDHAVEIAERAMAKAESAVSGFDRLRAVLELALRRLSSVAGGALPAARDNRHR